MAVSGGEQIGDGVARHTEQAGMAERYQAGITHQHVEPECEHGIEQNLAGDIDVIDFRDRVRHGDQREDRNGNGNAPGGHRTWPPNRPCGRSTSTSTIGRNRTK